MSCLFINFSLSIHLSGVSSSFIPLETWHDLKSRTVDVLPSPGVDRRSDWKCWAFYLRGAVPMNPQETQAPSEEKDEACCTQKATSNTLVLENKRSWSVRTHGAGIDSGACNNEPLDTLSIESAAQNNPETRYSELISLFSVRFSEGLHQEGLGLTNPWTNLQINMAQIQIRFPTSPLWIWKEMTGFILGSIWG